MSAPYPRLLRQRIAAALLAVGLLASVAAIAALSAAQLGGGAGAASPLTEAIGQASEGRRFTLIRWELQYALNRWLMLAGGVVYGEPSCDPREALAMLAGGSEPIDGREAQCVERALERAVSEAVSEAGLATPLPLFGSQAVVWPPVDLELQRAPRVLAISPRSEIRLVASRLLSPQLPRSEYGGIEAEIEAGGEWSAWIGGVGGVATYPALMVPRADWYDALRLAAHEWMHHYLIFHPLGQAYFESDELRTINETVADIAGDELGALAAGGAPELRSAAELEAPPSPAAAALRGLRLEVDALLAEGRVAEAEARMEARRGELAALGASYRRINQAFFAFRGGYADRPDAVSPYGPLLQQLRERSPSLAEFVAAVRGIASTAEATSVLEAR